jgi:hypothetical protein
VNLNRLGLVRFSTEPVDDYRRYALLEVQPRALDAAEKAASSISVYRSVYLSTFGQQFCDVCIDTTGYDAGGLSHQRTRRQDQRQGATGSGQSRAQSLREAPLHRIPSRPKTTDDEARSRPVFPVEERPERGMEDLPTDLSELLTAYSSGGTTASMRYGPGVA